MRGFGGIEVCFEKICPGELLTLDVVRRICTYIPGAGHGQAQGAERGRRWRATAHSIPIPRWSATACSSTAHFSILLTSSRVRYEMVRRHEADGQSVSEVAENFGVSRPTLL